MKIFLPKGIFEKLFLQGWTRYRTSQSDFSEEVLAFSSNSLEQALSECTDFKPKTVNYSEISEINFRQVQSNFITSFPFWRNLISLSNSLKVRLDKGIFHTEWRSEYKDDKGVFSLLLA